MPRTLSLAICAAAMAAGLWVDTRGVPLDLLAAWCASPDTPWQAAMRHWRAMPAAHAAMVAAAWLVPHGARVGIVQRTVHALALLLGMTAIALLGPAFSRLTGWPPAESLLVAMGAGMLLAGALLPAPLQGMPAMGKPAASVSRR